MSYYKDLVIHAESMLERESAKTGESYTAAEVTMQAQFLADQDAAIDYEERDFDDFINDDELVVLGHQK